MILLVTGGRAFDDVRWAWAALFRVHREYGIQELVNGDATGLDKIAKAWASRLGVPHREFAITPRDWNLFGRAAGPRRNQRILDESGATHLLRFPGGNGTLDMVHRWEAFRGNLSLLDPSWTPADLAAADALGALQPLEV